MRQRRRLAPVTAPSFHQFTGERRRRTRRPRTSPTLLILAWLIITVAGCLDAPPGPQLGQSPAALLPELPPPVFPICPQPGDGASPFPPDLQAPATVTAGAIAGSFSVSPTGEAVYSIPLVVPPGRAGMEPALALTYTSAAGDGVLGMGFSIEGLSSISRCPRDLAQDGAIAAVRDDNGDALCLDGKRLAPLGVAPDDPDVLAKAGEYRTLPDTFTRIRADLSTSGGWDAEKGPRSFTAYTKSGLIIDYGLAPSGRVLARHGVVRSWLATRIRDRNDNSIDIHYENELHPDEGYTVEHAPRRVEYTAHPLAPATRFIDFLYSDREDAATRTLHARGMALRRRWRLDRLQTKVGVGLSANVVREYVFGYTLGAATGRVLLEQIEECTWGGACKPPTRFTWHSGGSPTFEWLPTSIKLPESERGSLMPMDVTGDGLDDLVLADADMTGGSEQPFTNWSVAPDLGGEITSVYFNTSAHAFQRGHGAPPSPLQPELGTPIDYNQDGRADLFLHDVYGDHPTWKILLAKPDRTFAVHDTGITRPYPLTSAPTQLLRHPEASAHLADVTGDGVADHLQCAYNGVDYSWTLRRWIPAPFGFEAAGSAIDQLSTYPCDTELHAVDIDADGKVDLVVPELTGTASGPSTATAYDALSYLHPTGAWLRTPTKLYRAGAQLIFLDINGDGLPDAVEDGFQDHQLRTFFNTGDGFTDGYASLTSALSFPEADRYIKLAAPFDFNADGRQDLLLPMEEAGGTPSWMVLQANGTIGDGTFDAIDSFLPVELELFQDGPPTLADHRGPRVTDVDGDGIQDVLLGLNGYVHVFKSVLHEEDILATVTDGMAARDPGEPGFRPRVEITYGHLVDAATTSADFTTVPPEERTYLPLDHAAEGECTYPIRCAVGPRRVVSGYQLDGAGEERRRFAVAYRNGRYHRLGRGFLGFGARIVRDLDTGSGSAEFFDNTTWDPEVRAFPYAGQRVAEWRWSPTPALDGGAGEGPIELRYNEALLQTVKPPGSSSWFTLPIVRSERREQGEYRASDGLSVEEYVREMHVTGATELGYTLEVVGDYDQYGNILVENTYTPGADLTLHVQREFLNDEGGWILGRLTSLSECSTAADIQQCRTTTRAYNGAGYVEVESTGSNDDDPETQLTVWYDRDAYGNITRTGAEDAFGQQRLTCTSYDSEGYFPYAHRNPAGHLSFERYNRRLGVRTALVDPNGLATRWAYDGFGRLTLERRPDGTERTLTLTRTKDGGAAQDEWNVKLRVQEAGVRDETIQHDSLGRPVRRWTQGVQIGNAPAPRILEEVSFGALGERVARRTLPAVDPAPPNTPPRFDEFEYDGMGRVVRHVSPWLAVTTYHYEGPDVLITGPGGVTTRIEDDALGRPVRITDADGWPTLYSYGPFGGLWTVTDPRGAVTVTERDAYGRVRLHVDPDRGKTVAHYNGFGQRTGSKDAADRDVAFAYDPLGRPVARVDADGTTTWTWDAAPHGIGSLAETESPDGHRTSYGYDSFGRLQAMELAIDGESFAAGLSYDAAGRLATISYPQAFGVDSLTVRRDHDAYGHLVALRDDATSEAFWQVTAADGAGRITGESFGPSGAVTTTRAYFDDKDRVKSILTTAGAAVVQDLSYTYDDRLNLHARTDAVQGQTEHFRYDRLDRLTCAEVGLMATACPEPYSYAADGNILHKPGVGLYSYDPDHPHAIATAGNGVYANDAVGNQIARPGGTISYTAFDQPRSFTLAQGGSITLDYDGLQRRVRKSTSEAVTVYLDDLYERVTHLASGAVEHRYYIHADHRVVAVVTRQAGLPEQRRYLHVDALGSVDAVTTDGGAPPERRSYDAFGARRDPVWNAPPPASFASQTTLGFTGHEADEELGLVNMKGRLYDPKIGRFLTPDPVVSLPLFGQSWNPYSYALNSPLAYVDPSGFTPEEPGEPPPQGGGWLAPVRTGEHEFTIYVFYDEPVEGTRESAEVGATTVPTDVTVWGNTGGHTPQRSPVDADLQRGLDIATQTAIGEAEGIGEMALEVGKSLVLNALTFGGYGTYQLGKGIWQGYQEDGIVGGVNAVNPLYAIGRGAVDTLGALEREDYRAAGAAGIKTLVLGVATVFGIAEGVGALATRGAAGAGVAGAARRIPNPFGKKGGPAHQMKVQEIANDIRSRGLRPGFEYRVDTPGCSKSHRCVDVVARDSRGNVVEMHQVGKQTMSGRPVSREQRALDDIEAATQFRPHFHPYN